MLLFKNTNTKPTSFTLTSHRTRQNHWPNGFQTPKTKHEKFIEEN